MTCYHFPDTLNQHTRQASTRKGTFKSAGFFCTSDAVKFDKPPLSYDAQAALLTGRGMTAADPAALRRQLEVVGYYRLCSYWHPFKRPDDSFAPGTTFETVWRRYVFDRRLRLVVMDAVERVEVAVRTALVTELVMRHGAFAHCNRANFPAADPARHTKFVTKLRDEAQQSTEQFVEHFKATYDEFPDLPTWAAAETMTFGLMFTLFSMSDRRTQKLVARRFDLSGSVLNSWLRTLNYVRNICAHHARLWNRELAVKPLIPDMRHGAGWHDPQPVANNRVFVVLTMLRYLLTRCAPQSRWRDRVYELYDAFDDIPLPSMGMSDN